MDDVVAGAAGRGEDGGIRDGGALVAEHTAGDDGAHHIGHRQIEGNGHGESNGHHDGPHAPGGTGGEGDKGAEQEHQGRNQAGGEVLLHNTHHEVTGAHGFDDGAQRPGSNQNEGDIDQLNHAVNEGIKGLKGLEQSGSNAHDASADTAAQEGYADCQGDVGGTEAAHQAVVGQIAAPEDGSKQRDEQGSHRDDEVPDGQLIALGQHILYLGDQGVHAIAQQLTGLQSPLLLGAHGTEVQAENGDHNHCDHGEEAVQIEGQHVQPDAPLAGLYPGGQKLCGDQTGDKGTVAADGREAGQVAAHGVQNVGQLGPGHPHGVGDGTHNGAQHQAGLSVTEDERAQAGDDLAFLGRIDYLGYAVGKCLRCAGIAQHGNQSTGQGDQYQKGRISADRRYDIIRDNLHKAHQRIPAVNDSGTHPSGNQQGEDGLFSDQGEDDSQNRRY